MQAPFLTMIEIKANATSGNPVPFSHPVELDELGGGGLERPLDGGPGDDGLGHDALAPPVQPVDGRRLLVRAHVPRQRQHLHLGEPVILRGEA